MSNWLRVSIMLNCSNGGCLDATEGCIPEETATGRFGMTEKKRVKNGAPEAETNVMGKRGLGIGACTEEADAMMWEASDEGEVDTEVRKGFERIWRKTHATSLIDWRRGGL
jgi:hypothetical protein